MIKTVKEAKKILRKGKKYHAYNGDKKIGTTYAIDSARLLAVNYGDRVILNLRMNILGNHFVVM